MKKKLISIIIPIYNAQNYIEKCLVSIENQIDSGYEVIMVDDGSTDDSAKICKYFSKKYKEYKYYYQQNSGVSSARNNGIKKSNGEYIMFIDADDKIKKNCLSKCRTLINDNDIDIIKFLYEMNSKILKRKIKCDIFQNHLIQKDNFKDSIYKELFKRDIFCSCWGALIKKSLIIDNDIYFNEQLRFGEDFEFFTNCIKHSSNIYLLNDNLYIYKININSSTQKFENKKNIKFILDGIMSLQMIEDNLNLNKYNIKSTEKSFRNIYGIIQRCIANCDFYNYTIFIDELLKNDIINKELKKFSGEKQLIIEQLLSKRKKVYIKYKIKESIKKIIKMYL